MTQHVFIGFRQKVVSLARGTLPVLMLNIKDNSDCHQNRTGQHTNIDPMASQVPRPGIGSVRRSQMSDIQGISRLSGQHTDPLLSM